MLHFSTFTSATDNAPRGTSMTWEDLARFLTTYEIRASKNGPCWSPVTYAPGALRNNRNVLGITALVFDLDHLTVADFEAIETTLKAADLAYVLHSTHGHAPPEDCRFRLVFPVSRVIDPPEYARLRNKVIAHFRLPADPATKDLARIYYLPSHAPESAPLFESQVGEVLDVEAWLRQGNIDELPPRPAAVDLSEIRKDLGRGRPPKNAPWIPALLRGEALAEEGGRDNTLQKVCSYLAFRFSDAPLPALLHLLTPSISLMAGDEGVDYWMAVAEDKLERARAMKEEKDQEGDRLAAEMAAKDRLVASGGASADYYSDAEIAKWAVDANCSVEELRRRWIIQYRSNYFFLKNGAYTPALPREAAENDVHYTLSRAANRIDLTVTSQAGNERRRKLSELVQEYGTVIHQLAYSYLLKGSRYIPEEAAMHLAAAPRRTIEPKENPEIQHWLELMGGTERERLFDWLATFTQLEKPTAALYLRGPRGAGKNMLYLGLSRLWTTRGPTMLRADHFTKYNDEFLNCPLLVVDEAMPGAETSHKLDAYMRQLVTSESRPLLRKFMDGVTLQGANRVILAANKDDLLHFADDMTSDALAATAERYFYLRIDERAGEYLAGLGGRAHTEPWVAQDGIAAHVLWLAKTRQVRPYGRLLVSGQLAEMRSKIAASSGFAPHVCTFVINAMRDDRLRSALLKVGEGEVWVSSTTVCDEARWKTLVPGARCPTVQQAAAALRALSKSEKTTSLADNRGKSRKYYRLDVGILCGKAEELGLAGADELLDYTKAKDADIRRVLDKTADVISITG